jgi:hypothetical protein
MDTREENFEKWLIEKLKTRNFHELIDNFAEIKTLAKIYEKDPFTSNFKGALNQLLVQNWAKGILSMEQMKLVDNQIEIIKKRGVSSKIDILFRIEGKGVFSIVELKRPLSHKSKKKSTVREAVSELLGYANGLCTTFPGLPSKSNLLIIVSSEWPQVISNAVSLLSSFYGFSIIEINAEYKGIDEIVLTIRKPVDLYLSKKEGIPASVISCFSLDFSEKNIPPHILVEFIKQQIQDSGLNGFLVLSKSLNSLNDSDLILYLYIINPYLVLCKTLDESDVSIIKQTLGLSIECDIDNVKLELNTIAAEWDLNIQSLISESFNLFKLFNIKIDYPSKSNSFEYFVNYGHSEEILIHIDFIGFLTTYYLFWLKNEKNRFLVKMFCSDSDGWEYYEQFQKNPLTKLLAISDLFQISEFRRETLTAYDVFLHGRRWGKIENIAKIGTYEEYIAELPFFFISFARSPFKIPISMEKKGLALNGQNFVTNMCEMLSERGNSIYRYLFLIGYLIESKYYIPQSSKSINTFVVTNLEEHCNNFIRLAENSGYQNLSSEMSNLVNHLNFENPYIGDLSVITNCIRNFECFLKEEHCIDSIGWRYCTGKTEWTPDLKAKIKCQIKEL